MIRYRQFSIPWITTNNERDRILHIKKLKKHDLCQCPFTVVAMVHSERVVSTIIGASSSVLRAMRISVVIAV